MRGATGRLRISGFVGGTQAKFGRSIPGFRRTSGPSAWRDHTNLCALASVLVGGQPWSNYAEFRSCSYLYSCEDECQYRQSYYRKGPKERGLARTGGQYFIYTLLHMMFGNAAGGGWKGGGMGVSGFSSEAWSNLQTGHHWRNWRNSRTQGRNCLQFLQLFHFGQAR